MRIWAWDNPEHQLKIEVFGLGGAIKDLAWGPESKRIVVCGAGSGVNARAFMWDTGSNLGEVVGHSKRVISCDYRQVRPYRIMTGSEDHRTIFYQGPPFKMDHSNNSQHTNFVNCVRFSPDGSKIATCSSDKKVGVEPTCEIFVVPNTYRLFLARGCWARYTSAPKTNSSTVIRACHPHRRSVSRTDVFCSILRFVTNVAG